MSGLLWFLAGNALGAGAHPLWVLAWASLALIFAYSGR